MEIFLYSTRTTHISALDCSVSITITSGVEFSISIGKGDQGKSSVSELTSYQSNEINVDMYEKLFFFRESTKQQLYAHVKNDKKPPNRFFKVPARNTQKIHLLILPGKYYMI